MSSSAGRQGGKEEEDEEEDSEDGEEEEEEESGDEEESEEEEDDDDDEDEDDEDDDEEEEESDKEEESDEEEESDDEEEESDDDEDDTEEDDSDGDTKNKRSAGQLALAAYREKAAAKEKAQAEAEAAAEAAEAAEEARLVEEEKTLDPAVAAARQKLRQLQRQERVQAKKAETIRKQLEEMHLYSQDLKVAEESLRDPNTTAAAATASIALKAHRPPRLAADVAQPSPPPPPPLPAAPSHQQEVRRLHDEQAAAAQRLRERQDELLRQQALLEARRKDMGLPPAAAVDATPAQIRERYKATLAAQEQTFLQLRERQLRYDAQARGKGAYRGELGSHTYTAAQMDAYKASRSVVDDLIDELAAELCHPTRKDTASVGALEAELELWQQSHRRLTAGELDEPSEGRHAVRSCREAMHILLSAVVDELATEVAAEVKSEAKVAEEMSMRVLLEAVSNAAAGQEGAPVKDELRVALRDMLQFREQSERSGRQYHSRVSSKWKGARPRRHTVHDDGVISSESEEEAVGDEANEGLALDTRDEELPRGGVLRAALIEREQEYWHQTIITEAFVPSDEGHGSECTALACSSNGRLLASGCRGGGVMVYSLVSSAQLAEVSSLRREQKERRRKLKGGGKVGSVEEPSGEAQLPVAVRKLAVVADDGAAPAGEVCGIKWSADGTEVLTVDRSGTTRVWSVMGAAPLTYQLTADRASAWWAHAAAHGTQQKAGQSKAEAEEARKSLEQVYAKAERELSAVIDEPIGGRAAGGGGGSLPLGVTAPHLEVALPHRLLFHKDLLDDAMHAAAAANLAQAAKVAAHAPGAAASTSRRFKEPEKVEGSSGTGKFGGLRGTFLLRKSRKVEPADPPATEEKGQTRRSFGLSRKKAKAAEPTPAVVQDDAEEEPPPPAAKKSLWEEEEEEHDATLVDLPELMPSACDFHPAITLLGSQPSVILGLASGLVVKINRPGAERVVHSAPLNPPVGLADDREVDAAVAERKEILLATKEAAPVEAAAKSGKMRGRKEGSSEHGKPAPASKRKAKAERHAARVLVQPAIANSTIHRENFVGHGSRVICVGFIEHSSVMVSLDKSGMMLKWPYRDKYYSEEFKWFRPSEQRFIDLNAKIHTLEPGSEVVHFPPNGLQVPSRVGGVYPEAFSRAARSHDRRVVGLLRLPDVAWRTIRHDDKSNTKMYKAPRGHKRDEFVSVTRSAEGTLLRHETARYRRRMVAGELMDACLTPTGNELATLIYLADASEGPQLRLQLLNLKAGASEEWLPTKISIPMTSRRRPRIAIGPLLDVTGTDYAFVLMDECVRVFSLGTGDQVCVMRPGAPLPANEHLDSVAMSGDGRHLAVGSSQRQGFWLYTMQWPQGEVRTQLLKVRAGSSRLAHVPIEQRMREEDSAWILGTDFQGFPTTGTEANVSLFMRALVESIVDSAISPTSQSSPSPPTKKLVQT